MTARLVRGGVALWSDLEPAGGAPVGTGGLSCDTLSTTRREDGNDSLSGTVARGAANASSLQQGSVLRLERMDASIEEWILQTVTPAIADQASSNDRIAFTASNALTFLGERVLARTVTGSSQSTVLTFSGTPSAILASMISAFPEWPSWIVAGTVEPTDPIPPSAVVTITNQSALAALLAVRDAVNAIILEYGQVSRIVLRRVSASQCAIDWLVNAASGNPELVEGKNLTALAARTDRTQVVTQVEPVDANNNGIAEAYFWVENVDAPTTKVFLKDWAFRDDRLVVAFDGQWVGDYLIQLGDSTKQITASSAADQSVTVSSTTGWSTDDIVRIAKNSGGDRRFLMTRPNVTPLRIVPYQRTDLFGKTNWIINAQMESWFSSTAVNKYTILHAATHGQNTNPTYIETGSYSLHLKGDGTGGITVYALTSAGIQLPNEITNPGGGSVAWTFGARFYNISSAPGFPFGVSIGNGLTSGTASGTGTVGWQTVEATITTTSAHHQLIPQFLIGDSSASNECYLDRVWLFRTGVDDGDNTLAGCQPARLVYGANRLMLNNQPTTYTASVSDLFRDNPSRYPNDALAVSQDVRLVAPGLGGLDTTVRLVELTQDELNPLVTTVQLGTPRRRLSTIVAALNR